MKKRTKKITVMCVSLAMVAALGAGATMAYFSDKTDTKENVITMGNVKVELKEYDKDGLDTDLDFGTDVVPGQSITKKAVVENTGANDCYVRLHINLPKTETKTDGTNGVENKGLALKNMNIGTGMIVTDSKNTVIAEADIATSKATDFYVYYPTKMSSKEESGDIITGFTVPTDWKDNMTDLNVKIDVTAEAVQADNNGEDYMSAWKNVVGERNMTAVENYESFTAAPVVTPDVTAPVATETSVQ